MKIVKLVAENIKKLKAIEIIPVGNIVKITGACEQGKTTILDAIWWALGGEKNVQDVPVRKGAEKGAITLDLGDKIVTRTFTAAGGGALKVENKEGARYPSPQALLDGLIGKLTFDPRVFARADAKQQVDMLLRVVDLRVDSAKLKELSGVEVTVGDNPLQALNDAYKAVFDQRTVVNRQLDAAQKVLASMPEVEPVEPVTLTELVAEKERLTTVIEENKKAREAVAEQRRKTEQASQAVDGILNEITELERRLAERKKALEVSRKQLEEEDTKHRRMAEAAADLEDPDLADINTRIANADATNEKARQYENRQAKAAEVAGHQQESEALTGRLKSIIDYKEQLVKSTKFPIDGLNFAGGGVTYKELPFDQASSAEKIRISLAIGMALNPRLKVILIDGGEALDKKQMAIVEEMAKENDFQVWLTAVDESGKVGIYIEDGEVKAVNG